MVQLYGFNLKTNRPPFLEMNMRKPVIDIETLQVYPSLYNCAKMLNVTPPAVFNAIILNYKCKGHRFEYFEEWQHWSSGEKEQHTRKNNIYFI